MAASLVAAQMAFSAAFELVSVVWMEIAMFSCAAIAYFAFTGSAPWKTAARKKQPAAPKPTRGNADVQAMTRLLHQGKPEDAIAMWASQPREGDMPANLASQFLMALARAQDLEGAAAGMRSVGGQFPSSALDDVLTRAMARRDFEICRKVYRVASLLSMPKSSKAFEALANVYSSDTDGLRALVHEAPSPLTKHFAKVVLAACASPKNVDLSDEIFDKVDARDTAELRKFAEDVATQGAGGSHAAKFDPAACARDIRASGRKGDLCAATALFDGVLPSFKTGGALSDGVSSKAAALLINVLIDACAECGDLDRASECLARARGLGLADTVSFNTLMKGYLAAGKQAEAERLFAELLKSGTQVTHHSFHGLMNARVVSGDRKGAWRLLGEMRAAGMAPSLVTCAILLKSCTTPEHANDVQTVLEIVETQAEAKDEVLLVAVVEACLRTGRLDALSAFLERSAARGVSVTLAAATYGALIKAYGQTGDVKHVWAFWREMRERKVVPSPITVGCMVEALVRNGHAEGALRLVQEVCEDESQRHLVNTVTFSTLLKGSRQVDWVLQVYGEMRARSIPCNTITYNTILNVFAENGNMRRAPMLLEDMKNADPKVEPDVVTYSTLIKGFCGAGDLDRALELFGELKRDDRHAPDEVMYNSLLDGCAKAQRVKDALALVDDMQTRGVAPSNFTLSMLVKLLGRCNMLEQAFSMLEELSKKYRLRVNIPVYTCLIQACFQNRQPARAVALLDRLMEDGLRPDQVLFTALARGCIQARHLDQAVRMVQRAYETTPPCGVDSRLLDELVRKLGADSKEAESLLNDVHRKQSHVAPRGRRSAVSGTNGGNGLSERRAAKTASATVASAVTGGDPPWRARPTAGRGGR